MLNKYRVWELTDREGDRECEVEATSRKDAVLKWVRCFDRTELSGDIARIGMQVGAYVVESDGGTPTLFRVTGGTGYFAYEVDETEGPQ